MLADNARKEQQIREINRIALLTDALVIYATTGDDTQLKQATAQAQAAPRAKMQIVAQGPVTTIEENLTPVPEAPAATDGWANTFPVESGIAIVPTQQPQRPACPKCNSTAPGHVTGSGTCVSHTEATATEPVQAEPPRATFMGTPATDEWVSFVPVAPPPTFAPSSED